MRVLQTDFFGDHNLGLFSTMSEEFCLIGNPLSKKKSSDIAKVTGAKLFQTTIANSEIVGIFCSMNSNGIVIPKITTDREIAALKKFGKENDLNINMIGTKFTALGNVVLCNDNGAVVSNLVSAKDKKTIEDCLGVPAEYSTVAGLDSVGSCGLATNKGCILHRDATDEEIKTVDGTLKVESDIGTANYGSPFVGSCVIGNSNGVVAGDSTTGPEITRIMEALQLL